MEEVQQITDSKAANEIFIGKKPLMAYVTAALVRLTDGSAVTIKARGRAITAAVDVVQIMIKRMDNLGYKVEGIKLGSEQMQSQDGRTRNVSTIEIEVSREK